MLVFLTVPYVKSVKRVLGPPRGLLRALRMLRKCSSVLRREGPCRVPRRHREGLLSSEAVQSESEGILSWGRGFPWFSGVSVHVFDQKSTRIQTTMSPHPYQTSTRIHTEARARAAPRGVPWGLGCPRGVPRGDPRDVPRGVSRGPSGGS